MEENYRIPETYGEDQQGNYGTKRERKVGLMPDRQQRIWINEETELQPYMPHGTERARYSVSFNIKGSSATD